MATPLTGSANEESGSTNVVAEGKNNPPNASGVYNQNNNPMEHL